MVNRLIPRGLLSVEGKPVSRFRLGSPCRAIRALDVAVHVWWPAIIEPRAPRVAKYLRETSPRWGRSFRSWDSSTIASLDK
jgi:hypothetical protein